MRTWKLLTGFSASAGITLILIGGIALAGVPADEELLKKAHIGADDGELLAYFRHRTVGEPERQRIVALIRQLGNDAYAVRERAVGELIEVGLPAIGLLRQGLNDPDIEVARRCERCLQRIERDVPSSTLSAAVARVVAARKPLGAASVLLAYLPFADDEVVADELREALVAVALRDGRPDPVLVAALDDPLPIRRAAAVEALVRSKQPAAVAASRKLLEDSNPDVRLRAALALVTHAKDRQAVPIMIKLLADAPQSAGWRIEGVLMHLAGDTGPKISLGSDESAREKCRDAWMAWWDKEGAKIDLAKLDTAPPTLGYTLIVVRDPRAILGRVMEVNAAKETLWKIEGLNMPVDALIVGKDRVLIAEQNANQVSERDFRGTVIWTKFVILPVGLQRLPNGNTLVVSRNQIVEWDPQRNQIYVYERGQHDIVAATKLRDGDIIILTSQGKCIRLDKDRKEVKSFVVNAQNYYQFGGIEALPSGNLLLTQRDSVSEFDPDGKSSWSAPAVRPSSVQRLANGNTLVASNGSFSINEFDRSGKAVWDYKFADNSIPFRARRR
jgi:hypothetical protein